MQRVAILGAGISGLSLAYYLKKKYQDHINITLIEKDIRVGGLIRSEKKEGHIIEWGPKSIRPFGKGEFTEALIQELGLKKKELSCKTKKRYLLVRGRLRKVPSLFFLKKIFIGLIKDLFCTTITQEDETIASFCIRHFGKTFTCQFVDPFIKGIFAGDIHKLSVHACLPQLCEIEKKHRSLILGFKKRKNKEKKPPYSFNKGLQELPDKILEVLDAEVLLGTEVKNAYQKENQVNLIFKEGYERSFDFVFSTLPAYALKELDIGIANLDTIEFFDINVFTFCFDKKILFKEGFGYLVPEKEGEKILGAVFDSCLFDEVCTQITIMAKKSVTIEEAKNSLRKHLKIDTEPSFIISSTSKLPQYTLGHLQRVKDIEESIKKKIPRFKAVGSSFYGVSINDCIYQSKMIAEESQISFMELSS